jgi:hypothetical protein
VPEIWVAPSEKKVIVINYGRRKIPGGSPFFDLLASRVEHCFTVTKCASPHYVMGMVLEDAGTDKREKVRQ